MSGIKDRHTRTWVILRVSYKPQVCTTNTEKQQQQKNYFLLCTHQKIKEVWNFFAYILFGKFIVMVVFVGIIFINILLIIRMFNWQYSPQMWFRHDGSPVYHNYQELNLLFSEMYLILIILFWLLLFFCWLYIIYLNILVLFLLSDRILALFPLRLSNFCQNHGHYENSLIFILCVIY